jgi:hypothetical protein
MNKDINISGGNNLQTENSEGILGSGQSNNLLGGLNNYNFGNFNFYEKYNIRLNSNISGAPAALASTTKASGSQSL